jgi:hypothetical protein
LLLRLVRFVTTLATVGPARERGGCERKEGDDGAGDQFHGKSSYIEQQRLYHSAGPMDKNTLANLHRVLVEIEQRIAAQRDIVARLKDMRGDTTRAETLLSALESELSAAHTDLADLQTGNSN